MAQMFRIVTIALLLLFSACSERDRDTSSGEIIPRISSVPLIEDWQDVLTIERTHTFGVEGPAEHPEAWIDINSIKPGPRGTVLILDSGANRVDALDYERGIVGHYGYGPGSGPGELRAPSCMAWVPSVGVLVYSPPLQRITVFDMEGNYLRDIHPDRLTHDIATAGEKQIWIQPPNASDVDRVFLVDIESGDTMGEIGGRHTGQPWNDRLYLGCRITSTEDGLLVSTRYPYEVLHYEYPGRLLSVIGRKTPWLDPPGPRDWGPPSQNWNVKTGYVGRAFLFHSGMMMVELNQMIRTGTSPSGIPIVKLRTWFDFFTPGGDWLTTVPGDILFGDQNHGAITVTTDDAFWVMLAADHHQVVRFVFRFKRSSN